VDFTDPIAIKLDMIGDLTEEINFAQQGVGIFREFRFWGRYLTFCM
jgi:hypothetical protein